VTTLHSLPVARLFRGRQTEITVVGSAGFASSKARDTRPQAMTPAYAGRGKHPCYHRRFYVPDLRKRVKARATTTRVRRHRCTPEDTGIAANGCDCTKTRSDSPSQIVPPMDRPGWTMTGRSRTAAIGKSTEPVAVRCGHRSASERRAAHLLPACRWHTVAPGISMEVTP